MRPILLFSALFFSVAAYAATEEEIKVFAHQIEKPLHSARYMEDVCTPAKLKEWEGFDTQKCSYKMKDAKTGEIKPGLVILLDPTPAKLSAWILNACETVRPNEVKAACAERVFQQIKDQSGGQFPVSGIVYEDILPQDGIYEAYGFADGVTSVLKGIKYRRTTAFSSQELEAAITAIPTRTASERAPARVVGVTRKEYLLSYPEAKVTGLGWLNVVREEYKKAMNGDRNVLIEAWLKAN